MVFFFLCCSESFLFASISDHFKKVEVDFPHIHKMKNIDFIYMINLDQRPEKFASCQKQLNPYGIYPFRFSAVNGWELTPEILEEVGLRFVPGMTPLMATTYPKEAKGKPSYEFMEEYGKTYFCHHMSRGSIGCSLSHFSVLQDAFDRGYRTIWVMEDDIEVVQDPRILSELIDRLDALVGEENWDVLFTDQNYRIQVGKYAPALGVAKRPDMDCSYAARFCEKYTIQQDISVDFKRISARFGNHSMILRRSGIEKLLAFAQKHKIFLSSDLDNYFTVNRYGVRYDIVSNMINAITDNAAPIYEQKEHP